MQIAVRRHHLPRDGKPALNALRTRRENFDAEVAGKMPGAETLEVLARFSRHVTGQAASLAGESLSSLARYSS